MASAEEGKVALVVNLDNSLAGELDAVKIVRELGPIIGGGGGGRATLAEAGGKNVGRRPRRARSGPRQARLLDRVKVLALDFGSARTGVAVSDPTGTVARPLATIQRVASDAGFASSSP